MQNYRNLRVWRKSHENVLEIRKAANRFPRSGYTALKLQLTRSAESIPYNIVEGCGASTPKEFARFLDISIKSAFEAEYQLQLARDYEIMPTTTWKVLSDQTVIVRKMLFRLRRRVLGDESDSGSEDTQ